MGEVGFNVYIQKVCRYLQVIAPETQDICGTLTDIIRAIDQKSTTSIPSI